MTRLRPRHAWPAAGAAIVAVAVGSTAGCGHGESTQPTPPNILAGGGSRGSPELRELVRAVASRVERLRRLRFRQVPKVRLMSATRLAALGLRLSRHARRRTAASRLRRARRLERATIAFQKLAGLLPDEFSYSPDTSAGLEQIGGVRLRTPASADLSAGIVCCELDGVRPGEAVRRLRDEHRVIASVTPYATEYVRFGTGLMVDEDDVDAAVEAVRALT
jgi:hypothetical protein